MVDFGPEGSIRIDGSTFARGSEFNAVFHSVTNDYPLPVLNRYAILGAHASIDRRCTTDMAR